MGDAEWMYENDLDPLYRKDRDTGELVEWEGGLNPAYVEDEEPYSSFDEYDRADPLETNIFHTYEAAKAWAKNNPGKSIVRNSNGHGYVVKDSRSSSNDCSIEEQSDKLRDNIDPLVYNKIKNYLTRDKVQKSNFKIKSMRVTKDYLLEVSSYIWSNNLITDWHDSDDSCGNGPETFDPELKRYMKSLVGSSGKSTPKFSTEANFRTNIYVITSKGSVASRLSSKKGSDGKLVWKDHKDKARRCKTILDLYFDILEKSPNDLLDISFETQ